MPLLTGTLTLEEMEQDTNAAETRLAQMGEERVTQAIATELDTHNTAVAEQLAEFAEITTDAQRRDAASGTEGDMVPLTQTGRAPTQIVTRGTATVGFPLEGWQYAIGWTQRALDRASATELAKQVRGAEFAHIRKLQARLKQALYGATNVTVRDYLSRNQIDLAVKRFYNGDGWDIPMGPNGEVFDGATHSHYLVGPLTAAKALALIGTVREHNPGADVRVVIAQEDEAEWTAITGFRPYIESDVLRAAGDLAAGGGRDLDVRRPNNRAIGRMNGAEVWIKPWAISEYPIAYALSGPRPLALRVSDVAGVAGGARRSPALRIAATNRAYPLLAEFMEAEFGFAANNRAGAAILWTGGADGDPYTEPTITG